MSLYHFPTDMKIRFYAESFTYLLKKISENPSNRKILKHSKLTKEYALILEHLNHAKFLKFKFEAANSRSWMNGGATSRHDEKNVQLSPVQTRIHK
jgi:hypothetical protein